MYFAPDYALILTSVVMKYSTAINNTQINMVLVCIGCQYDYTKHDGCSVNVQYEEMDGTA